MTSKNAINDSKNFNHTCEEKKHNIDCDSWKGWEELWALKDAKEERNVYQAEDRSACEVLEDELDPPESVKII